MTFSDSIKAKIQARGELCAAMCAYGTTHATRIDCSRQIETLDLAIRNLCVAQRNSEAEAEAQYLENQCEAMGFHYHSHSV